MFDMDAKRKRLTLNTVVTLILLHSIFLSVSTGDQVFSGLLQAVRKGRGLRAAQERKHTAGLLRQVLPFSQPCDTQKILRLWAELETLMVP